MKNPLQFFTLGCLLMHSAWGSDKFQPTVFKEGNTPFQESIILESPSRQEITESIQEAITYLTKAHLSPCKDGFLMPLPCTLPTEIFKRVSDSFIYYFQEHLHDEPWNVHFQEFGLWAETLRKIVVDNFPSREGYVFASHYKLDEKYAKDFKKELNKYLKKKKTTYEWFCLFVDRLSILATPPHKRCGKGVFNTFFDLYKLNAMEATTSKSHVKRWLSHRAFKRFYQKSGIPLVDHFLSPLYQIQQFPHIFRCPYPFPLNDEDILRSMTFPEPVVWYMGLLVQTTLCRADGVLMTPAIFHTHDDSHLALVMNYLYNSMFILKKSDFNEITCDKFLSLLSSYHQERVRIYEMCFKEALCLINQTRDEDEKRLLTFLFFYIFHETFNSFEERLSWMLDGKDKVVSHLAQKPEQTLLNEGYYLNLLPSSMKHLSGDEFLSPLYQANEILWRHFDKVANEQVKSFRKRLTDELSQYFLSFLPPEHQEERDINFFYTMDALDDGFYKGIPYKSSSHKVSDIKVEELYLSNQPSVLYQRYIAPKSVHQDKFNLRGQYKNYVVIKYIYAHGIPMTGLALPSTIQVFESEKKRVCKIHKDLMKACQIT